jgi:hypothetical protein
MLERLKNSDRFRAMAEGASSGSSDNPENNCVCFMFLPVPVEDLVTMVLQLGEYETFARMMRAHAKQIKLQRAVRDEMRGFLTRAAAANGVARAQPKTESPSQQASSSSSGAAASSSKDEEEEPRFRGQRGDAKESKRSESKQQDTSRRPFAVGAAPAPLAELGETVISLPFSSPGKGRMLEVRPAKNTATDDDDDDRRSPERRPVRGGPVTYDLDDDDEDETEEDLSRDMQRHKVSVTRGRH